MNERQVPDGSNIPTSCYSSFTYSAPKESISTADNYLLHCSHVELKC